MTDTKKTATERQMAALQARTPSTNDPFVKSRRSAQPTATERQLAHAQEAADRAARREKARAYRARVLADESATGV